VRQLIAHARALPGVTAFRVSYVPGDGDAGVFYRRHGFRDTGAVDDGEVVLELDFSDRR
jgi:diamine N-acetyltransferase